MLVNGQFRSLIAVEEIVESGAGAPAIPFEILGS
jgi:hypothetical protein